MRVRIVLYLFFILSSVDLYGQDQNKRMNVILFIDDEIPVASITDGSFLIKDSSGITKDQIAFDYHVGGLIMSSLDYKKLFSPGKEARVVIKFKFKQFQPQFAEYVYEVEIPVNWFNEEYMILKVYNSSKKANRRKYFFKEKEYVTEIKIPGSGTIPITRR